jgi:large subunit ribosomal protein L9
MQIILLEKVVNLGQLGEVVKVKDGYARNFLIPQGKARRATQAALAEFATRRAEIEKVEADRLAAATAAGEKLGGHLVTILEKAGVDGRLFGSVGSADIAAALGREGFKVEKTMVRLADGPLKAVGEHAVRVSLHTDVTVDVRVAVKAA